MAKTPEQVQSDRLSARISKLENNLLIAGTKLADAERQLALTVAEQHKIAKMVEDLHSALIVPQFGYEEGLLERMAKATMQLEAGGMVMKNIVRWAQFTGAVGALATFIYAIIKFGDRTP